MYVNFALLNILVQLFTLFLTSLPFKSLREKNSLYFPEDFLYFSNLRENLSIIVPLRKKFYFWLNGVGTAFSEVFHLV